MCNVYFIFMNGFNTKLHDKLMLIQIEDGYVLYSTSILYYGRLFNIYITIIADIVC